MTKEEKKLVSKTINLAYQMIKEEVSNCNFEVTKETLVDYFMEFDNGFSDSIIEYINKKWDKQ